MASQRQMRGRVGRTTLSFQVLLVPDEKLNWVTLVGREPIWNERGSHSQEERTFREDRCPLKARVGGEMRAEIQTPTSLSEEKKVTQV